MSVCTGDISFLTQDCFTMHTYESHASVSSSLCSNDATVLNPASPQLVPDSRYRRARRLGFSANPLFGATGVSSALFAV